MPAHLTRMIAAAATAIVAAATAVVVQLVTDQLSAALVTLVGALVAGAAAIAVLGRPAAAAGVAAGRPATADTDRADRDLLIATCLYLRDRLSSAALTERLDRDLASAGVVAVAPLGEKFDPAVHAAEGALPTAETQLVGTIAVVDAPGFADRGVLLRPPTVTVYQPAPADATEKTS